jgi:hypothetical protein
MWLGCRAPNWAPVAFVLGEPFQLHRGCSLTINLGLPRCVSHQALYYLQFNCALYLTFLHLLKEPCTMDQNAIHSPLDPDPHQIRLLVLYPGQQDEPIHCSLELHYIDELQTYEALSYVWGDASLTSPIYIGPSWTKFDATTNLACALSHLRFHDKNRVLWVDALCP